MLMSEEKKTYEVALLRYQKIYNYDHDPYNGSHIIEDSISDWETVNEEEYKLLLNYLFKVYSENDFWTILLTRHQNVKLAISDAMKLCEEEEAKAKAKKEKAAAVRAKNKALKAEKTKADRLKQFKELQKEFE
jgi:hypothetical protein